MSRSCVGVMVPLATPVVSQFGSWLCQTSVWPRTRWWFARANATSWSACEKSSTPCVGSTTCHFMTFSGVTELNSDATRAL